MGVTQLWQVLAPVEHHQSLASLEGLTLAVDLSIWVCETQCVKQMQGVVSKPFLRNLFFRISHLTQLGVKLVFVIEGTAPQLKWEVMMQRQQTRYPGRQGKQLSRGPVSKQTRRNFNACLKECCELLDILGVPYIQSRGEAEAMCALLNASGLVDGCLTNDGDAFLYGARTVYRNFTMNIKDPHVEMYSMCEVETQLEVDRHGLVALGLLLGCDFVPKGVPGIGVANATRLLQSLKGMDVLKRLQEWRTLPESQCVNQAEVLARRKALSIPDFPQIKVIQEFLKAKDRCPTSISPWRRPVLAKFQDFALVKMEWPVDYTLEKVLPLVTLWDMQDVLNSSNPSTHQHLKPHRIVKTRIRQGVACYEVEWIKPVTDTSQDGDFYVTIETQDMFVKSFPQIVRKLELESAETGKKKKKNQGKRKKSAGKTAKNINDALSNLSFNLEKLDIGTVTANFQQSAKSLPQWLPEDEGEQSMLTTKLKPQKHYSVGHAIAPCSNSCTGTCDSGVEQPASFTTGISSPNPVFSVNNPDLMKAASRTKAVGKEVNDSDEENVLPFLERVKLRMKAKSQSAVNPEVKLKVESPGASSAKKKKRKKKGTKSEGHDTSKSDIAAKLDVPPRTRNTGKSFIDMDKNDHNSTADLSDMNSLIADIEHLSLLKENALRHRNGGNKVSTMLSGTGTTAKGVFKSDNDVGHDSMNHRLSFLSSSVKASASPVTPFSSSLGPMNAANLRKMSSPSCEGVCSPMSYIQHSGEFSDSFEIRHSPDNVEKNLNRSKKKSKKARKAALKAQTSMNDFSSCSPQTTGASEKQAGKSNSGKPSKYMNDIKSAPRCESSPAQLSGLDASALKEFGDFSIQHSLLNSLCASLVQAITPKGISKEEYENLCAALNKLEGKDEHSSSAQEWIESEIDKSLDKVNLADVEAVSNSMHKSFSQAAGLNSVNLNNSMQAGQKHNLDLAINTFDSDEYKHLSKSARKKLRRKERLKLLSCMENSPLLPKGNNMEYGSERNTSLNLQKLKLQNNWTAGKTSINHTIASSNLNKKKNVEYEVSGKAVSKEMTKHLSNGKCAPDTGHLRNMVCDRTVKATTTKDMRTGSKECLSSMIDQTNDLNCEDGIVEINENTEESTKKKKKKRKKKKVKKAQPITNLSADESMFGDLQSMICSDYLRKALENLRQKSQGHGTNIEKASPVMDFSADETLLELEDLSCNLAGEGPCLDNKTRLKLARKRSSLEKMSQNEEKSRQDGADKDIGTSSVPSEQEPVLSLTKAVVHGEMNGECEELLCACEETIPGQVVALPNHANDNPTKGTDEGVQCNCETGDGVVVTELTEAHNTGSINNSDGKEDEEDVKEHDAYISITSNGEDCDLEVESASSTSSGNSKGMVNDVKLEGIEAGDQEIAHSADSAEHMAEVTDTKCIVNLADCEIDFQEKHADESSACLEEKVGNTKGIVNLADCKTDFQEKHSDESSACLEEKVTDTKGIVNLADCKTDIQEKESDKSSACPGENVTHLTDIDTEERENCSVKETSNLTDFESEGMICCEDIATMTDNESQENGTCMRSEGKAIHFTDSESQVTNKCSEGFSTALEEEFDIIVISDDEEADTCLQDGVIGSETECVVNGGGEASKGCDVTGEYTDICHQSNQSPSSLLDVSVNNGHLQNPLNTEAAEHVDNIKDIRNGTLDNQMMMDSCNEQGDYSSDIKSCSSCLTGNVPNGSAVNGHYQNTILEMTQNAVSMNGHCETEGLVNGQSITEHELVLTNGHHV